VGNRSRGEFAGLSIRYHNFENCAGYKRPRVRHCQAFESPRRMTCIQRVSVRAYQKKTARVKV
jgi:hypothetical protein